MPSAGNNATSAASTSRSATYSERRSCPTAARSRRKKSAAAAARLALQRLEPLMVERRHRIVRGQEPQQRARKLGASASTREAIEGEGALPEPVEQVRLAQQPQMARDPRLTLPEDRHEIADGELSLGTKQHQAQPGRLRHRSEPCQNRLHRASL